MELWIRSQDREMLLKTTSLCIEIQNDVDPRLHTFNIFANGIKIGNYKTKERALEVLDEIQNILMPKVILNASSIKPIGEHYTIDNGVVVQNYTADAKWEQVDTYVYEMPSE